MNATAEVEEVQSTDELLSAVSLSAWNMRVYVNMLADLSERINSGMTPDRAYELKCEIYAMCRAATREIEDIDKRVKAHS